MSCFHEIVDEAKEVSAVTRPHQLLRCLTADPTVVEGHAAGGVAVPAFAGTEGFLALSRNPALRALFGIVIHPVSIGSDSGGSNANLQGLSLVADSVSDFYSRPRGRLKPTWKRGKAGNLGRPIIRAVGLTETTTERGKTTNLMSGDNL